MTNTEPGNNSGDEREANLSALNDDDDGVDDEPQFTVPSPRSALRKDDDS